MKNVYSYVKKSSQPGPSVKRFSSGSGMLRMSEYTAPESAKSFSDSDEKPTEDLSSKVTELTSKVDQLTELVNKILNQRSDVKSDPEVKTGSAEESTKTEDSKSNQPNDGDSAATGNEETNEEAKGAEVPGNTGTYTQVPEDEIVAQFSQKVTGKSSIVIPSLGNKDQFNVLYK